MDVDDSDVVTRVKGLGWLQPEHAPLGKLSDGVQERGDIDKEMITGPVVIDFRRSPTKPMLESNLEIAASAFEALQTEVNEAEREEQASRSQLKAAKSELEDAIHAEDEWEHQHDIACEVRFDVDIGVGVGAGVSPHFV